MKTQRPLYRSWDPSTLFCKISTSNVNFWYSSSLDFLFTKLTQNDLISSSLFEILKSNYFSTSPLSQICVIDTSFLSSLLLFLLSPFIRCLLRHKCTRYFLKEIIIFIYLVDRWQRELCLLSLSHEFSNILTLSLVYW